jgi:hypothetical protein
MKHRLRVPAPRRASCKTPGGFSSHPFTESEVLSTLASGGWFNFSGNYHDFVNRKTASFAVGAQMFFDELRNVG